MKPLNLDVLAAASLNASFAVTVEEGEIPKEFRGRKIEVHDLFVDHEKRKVLIHINGNQPIALDLTEGFVPKPAGSSVNVAFGLSRLGMAVGIIGAIDERDMFGTQLVASLQAEEIPLMPIPRGIGTPVTLSAIEAKSDHAQTTLFNFKPPYDLPTNQAMELLNGKNHRFVLATGVRRSEVELLTRLFHLQTDNFLVPNESICMDAGDVNVQLLLKLTNKLQVNFEEAEALSNCKSGDLKEMAHIISAMGPKKVIITLGKNGVFLGRFDKPHQPKYYEQAAFSAAVVDDDGAGDGFSVGFVYSLLSKHRVKKCLEVGAWVAARNIEQIGGYGGMPTHEEVAQLLK